MEKPSILSNLLENLPSEITSNFHKETLVPLLSDMVSLIAKTSNPSVGVPFDLSFLETTESQNQALVTQFKEISDDEIAIFDNGENPKILIDNGGFIQLVDFMGNDLSVVRAARASYNKQVSNELLPRDLNLLQYLWTHQHTSPFRHCSLSFIVRCPIFVLRQWQKHQVGCAWTFELNEQSGRYVKLDHGNFRPKEWRYQDTKNKQSSFGALPKDESDKAYALLDLAYFVQDFVYSELIKMGIAREQARIHNAVGQYTQCMWTGSLQAIMHFLTLRNKPEAQKETRDYAEGIQHLAYTKFPQSLKLIEKVIEQSSSNTKI